jgi:hypothetical protein
MKMELARAVLAPDNVNSWRRVSVKCGSIVCYVKPTAAPSSANANISLLMLHPQLGYLIKVS